MFFFEEADDRLIILFLLSAREVHSLWTLNLGRGWWVFSGIFLKDQFSEKAVLSFRGLAVYFCDVFDVGQVEGLGLFFALLDAAQRTEIFRHLRQFLLNAEGTAFLL
jgi:hypothetical protein